MDIRKIKKLLELLKKMGGGEIEIREGEELLRINCYPRSPVSGGQAPVQVDVVTESHSPVGFSLEMPVSNPVLAGSASGVSAAPLRGYTVKSPMVGTIYLSPAPGEKPFVEVGQFVKAGETLCVIEAMKMFNQIESDKTGVVSARLIENAQVVEYDQPLFIIEES